MATENEEEPVTAGEGENEQPAAELAEQLAEETVPPQAEAKPRETADQIKVVIVIEPHKSLSSVHKRIQHPNLVIHTQQQSGNHRSYVTRPASHKHSHSYTLPARRSS